jgi:hypothetical protein
MDFLRNLFRKKQSEANKGADSPAHNIPATQLVEDIVEGLRQRPPDKELCYSGLGRKDLKEERLMVNGILRQPMQRISRDTKQNTILGENFLELAPSGLHVGQGKGH